MAFQIKDFVSIAASMVNWMRTTTTKITDYNIGGVARTLVEAPAAEIDELYQQAFIGLREAIPVSVYNSFNFTAIAAVPATGLVRVNIAAQADDVLIVAGTTFKVTGKSVVYTSTEDRTIEAGDTFADVPVACDTPGTVGNIVASGVFTPSPKPDGYVSAANTSAIINGLDAETDEERKLRFAAYIAALNRGTVAALEYGLKLTVLEDSDGHEIERVAYTAIVEPWLTDSDQPISLVNTYVHNGSGGTTNALVLRAKEVLYGYYDAAGKAVPGWKAAGVRVEVFAATEQLLTVRGTITPLAGYVVADLIAAAEAAIADYITGLNIGVSAIRSEMIALVMAIEGVYNFVPIVPTGDTAVAVNVKLMPGTIAMGSAVLTPTAGALSIATSVPTRLP